MAKITPQGVVARDLTGWRTLLEERFRGAFGDDLAVEPETPAGSQIGVMASTGAELDEAVVAIANDMSPARALGVALDTHGEVVDLRRHGATRSRVTLTLTGVVGTTVTKGAQVKTDGGQVFRTVADAVIPNGGSVAVVAEAIEAGPVEAGPATLTNIVTLITGWETVTNAEAAVPGIAKETDLAYRARRQASTARLARGPTDAIVAALIEAGATDFRVVVNETVNEVVLGAFTVPAYSLFVIVKGGQDADIAAAIVKSKSGGVPTYAGAGAQARTVDAIKFRRPAEVAVQVNLTIDVFDDFESDGIVQIKRNLVAYADGTWRGGTGQFDTRGFRIGEPIDLRRLQSPINAVQGHQITALAVVDTDGAALPAATPADRLYTLATANISVTANTA